MAAAFRSDLPNPGDVLPVTMAGFELLFMRDQQGKIRCFHNVCRHRGNKLVTEPKSCVKSLQCGLAQLDLRSARKIDRDAQNWRTRRQ